MARWNPHCNCDGCIDARARELLHSKFAPVDSFVAGAISVDALGAPGHKMEQRPDMAAYMCERCELIVSFASLRNNGLTVADISAMRCFGIRTTAPPVPQAPAPEPCICFGGRARTCRAHVD